MGELTCDVAVVGAGLAGLEAARRLLDAGIDARVVEARDRVGGRLLSRRLDCGAVVDLGGQWVGPMHHRVLAAARAHGLDLFPTHVDGDSLFLVDGAVQRRPGLFPELDPETRRALDDALGTLDTLRRQVPPDAPWTAPGSGDLDGQTYASWIDAHVPSAKARNALAYIALSVFSVEAHELSLLHLLFYVAAAGGIDALINTREGAQDLRFVEGAQQLPIRMARALGDRVHTGAPVHRIAQQDGGVSVHGDGLRVRARRAVVALPPTLAGRLDYAPPMAGLRDQYTQRAAMGTVIKVMAVYARPFWRGQGLSGLASSPDLPVSLVYDNSPADAAVGILVGFLEADAGRVWGRRGADARRACVTDCLVRLFGPQAADIMDYVELDWAQEAHTRGAYGGYMPPGAWTSFGRAVREPAGRIHWAGTETATVWSGYMEGALQSGERAADEVLVALKTSGS
ncbi:flavin monoamine oxidase family protein [Methylobacterium sp. JK268]